MKSLERELKKLSYDKVNHSPAENSGYMHGLPFHSFVSWIINSCKSLGIKKVYYCTREGEFFKQIHDKILSSSPMCPSEQPESELLEVSRMSTFLPSLSDCNREEFSRLWRQYDNQTIDEFCASLNLPVEEVQGFLATYSLSISDYINSDDSRVDLLWQDINFKAWLKSYVVTSKNFLLSYLKQKQITAETNSFAMVDIGWRGTIQDNIAYILPQTQIFGYYFGLIPALNPQPSNVNKHGYFNRFTSYKVILKSPTPIEFLANSNNGSVINYHLTNNCVSSNRQSDKVESEIFLKFILPFQSGVLDFVSDFNSSKIKNNFDDSCIDSVSYKVMYRLMCNPPKEASSYFFMYPHNEIFGMAKTVTHNFKMPRFFLLHILFKRNGLKKLRKFLNSTRWPQAYLKVHNLSLLLPIYNFILKFENKI